MPFYEYRCSDCGNELEVLQKLSDKLLVDCPSCGKPTLSKMVSAAGFQLKGSGWYVTDFREGNKGKKDAGESGSKEAASSDAKSSDKSGDGSSAGKKDESKSGESKKTESSKTETVKPAKSEGKSSGGGSE